MTTDNAPVMGLVHPALDDSFIPTALRLALSPIAPPRIPHQLSVVEQAQPEKKRKRDETSSSVFRNDDDNDEDYGVKSKSKPPSDDDYAKRFPSMQQAADIEEFSYWNNSRDLLEAEKKLCEGLMLYPTSQYLNGRLITSLVRLSVSKRVQKIESCQSRLEEAFSQYSYSLFYINVDSARTARAYIIQRDRSLLSLFHTAVDKARKGLEGKSPDEIAALLVEQAEKNRDYLQSQIDTKKKQQVARVRKAAEKLSIMSMSTASTADDDADPQIDKLNDSNLECVVCFASHRQICLVPCGHIVMCQMCAISILTCPICTAKIEQKIKFIVS